MTISISLWVFVAVATVPSLGLLAVVLKMTRLNRQHKKNQKIHQHTELTLKFDFFRSEIQQQIFNQQIDMIFQSIISIVEAEHLKLKALSQGWVLAQPSNHVPQKEMETPPKHNNFENRLRSHVETNDALGKKLDECIEARMTPEEIANQLKLSLSEVGLAIRLQQNTRQGTDKGRQLEAVA